MTVMNLPTDLPRKYRYALKVSFFAGSWRHSYELIGAKGGINVWMSGPNHYDGEDHWSCGVEVHSRSPLHEDHAPSQDQCWLLNCPCWHDGSSLYGQRMFLPMIQDGYHDLVFRQMARDADELWAIKCEEVES